MEQAIREVRLESGVEMPIEVYDIRAKMNVDRPMMIPHYHEHIEFLYADRECDVTVWVAGESVSLRTGELVIVNSNVAHTFTNLLPMNKYICVKALPNIIYSADSSFFDMKYVSPFFGNSLVSYQKFSREAVEGTEVPQSFVDMLSERSRRQFGYEISLKSLLLRIFLWTVRNEGERGGGADLFKGAAENVRLIRRSVEYINSHYEDVSEEQAAATVNMSYSHYSRQFKAVMGINFCEYLNITRINAAEKLLITTEMSVTEIAIVCGFATSSHFIESFKRIKGATPGKYRQIWAKK